MKLALLGGGGFRVPLVYQALMADTIKHLHETEECTKKHYAIRQVEVRSDHH